MAAPRLPSPDLLPLNLADGVLAFHESLGFDLPLLSMKGKTGRGFQLVAFAKSVPTVPEYLGSGWHWSLDRIVACRASDFSKVDLFLTGKRIVLSRQDWTPDGTMLFRAPDLPSAILQFFPQDDRWTYEDEDLQLSFQGCPKSNPRSWFLSSYRERVEGGLHLDFFYQHQKGTQLYEIRSVDGSRVRFEHSPLRGQASRLLLRAISVENSSKSTVARLQFSYALHEFRRRRDPILQSILLRRKQGPERDLHLTLDYFPPTTSSHRPLRALSASSRQVLLFVRDLSPDAPAPIPLRSSVEAAETGIRYWHGEEWSLVVEQFFDAGSPALSLRLFQWPDGRLVHETTVPNCLSVLRDLVCWFAEGQVLLVCRNESVEHRHEIVLLRQESREDPWISYCRDLEAIRTSCQPLPSGELSLQVVQPGDPHTVYQYHWFSQPREWTLTSLDPLSSSAELAPVPDAELILPDQDSLFGRNSLPRNREPAADLGRIRREDQIDWRPGELFGSPETTGIALAS